MVMVSASFLPATGRRSMRNAAGSAAALPTGAGKSMATPRKVDSIVHVVTLSFDADCSVQSAAPVIRGA